MPESPGTGRFPMPQVPWIVRQLPQELFGLFGFRGEEIPESYRDEVEYLYTIAYPDGSPYRMPVLVQYVTDPGEPTVAFVVGDRVTLDETEVVVTDWVSREIPAGGGVDGYTYHQVTVALPEAADG